MADVDRSRFSCMAAIQKTASQFLRNIIYRILTRIPLDVVNLVFVALFLRLSKVLFIHDLHV